MTEQPPIRRTPPSRRDPSIPTELTELRDALATLHHHLQSTSEIGAQTAGLLAEVLPRLDDLTDRVTHTEVQLAELLAEPDTPPNPPLHWPTLTADQAPQEWVALAEWVADVLVDWYHLDRTELPDCWPLHRRAVLELSWLRTTYIQAHFPRSSPSLAAEWHVRWRPGALAAIAAAIPTDWCRPGEHLIHHLDLAHRADHPDDWTRQPGVQFPGPQRAEPHFWRPHLRQAIEEDLQRR